MTKQRFIQHFGGMVAQLGFRRSPFGMGFRYPIFFRLHENFVLTLVLQFSTLNRGSVTASWYLGATFHWGYVPDGVGYCVYLRVPTLLTLDDRRELIGQEDVVAEGFDYWWSGLQESTLESLFKSVARTEPRFLAQAPMKELRKSSYYKERRDLCGMVRKRVSGPAPSLGSLEDPRTLAPWLAAARDVVKTDGRLHRSEEVTRILAEDAAMCAAVGLVS